MVPTGGIADRLGRLTHDGYKIWDWRWDQEAKAIAATAKVTAVSI